LCALATLHRRINSVQNITKLLHGSSVSELHEGHIKKFKYVSKYKGSIGVT
jgi:hypothetical protein